MILWATQSRIVTPWEACATNARVESRTTQPSTTEPREPSSQTWKCTGYRPITGTVFALPSVSGWRGPSHRNNA